MKVNHFIYDGDHVSNCQFGMSVTDYAGETYINLFEIAENEGGPKLRDYLWGVSDYVLNVVYRNQKKRNQVKWTYSCGSRCSDIEFQEVNGQPVGLALSDRHAFSWPTKHTINEYQEELTDYGGKPHKKELVRERRMEDAPRQVFAVPCDKAKDGVFYCELELDDENHEVLFVDTRKLLDRIDRDDPKMMNHAKTGFFGIDGTLENNSMEHPFSTGCYTTDRCRPPSHSNMGFFLIAGYAPLLQTLKGLDLSYVPIVIQKAANPQHQRDNDLIKEELGYFPPKRQPSMKPSFM